MKSKKMLLAILFIATSLLSASAQVIMSSVFSDNMVLQQKEKAAIWGWARATSKVSVVGSWNNADTVSVNTSNDGSWKVQLPTTEAGGPYTLTIINNGKKTEFKNVMLGEVWICSGQSNMEWSVNHGVKDGEAEAAAANNPNIRIFQIPLYGAATPQSTCDATWVECNSATMRTTSAVGYFFARELNKKLNVPVGIIVSAWGGTSAEVWTPVEALAKEEGLKNNIARAASVWWPNVDGALYNQMIHPLIPYNIKGAIWYQGESNTFNAPFYGHVMKALIASWRERFGKEFPFYMAQIAPFAYNEKGEGPQLIREKQEMVSKLVPNTGMIVVSDLVDDVKNIHPLDKQNVGLRFANMAFAEQYGLDIKGYKSPTFASMEVKGNKAIISFHDATGVLKICDDKAVGVQVAGADGKFVDATSVKVDGNKLVVSAKGIKAPEKVQYSYHESTIGNIFSESGLPVAPFRSDIKLEL